MLRLVATDRCRVALPWFSWAHAHHDAAGLRRRANALERRRLHASHPFEQALAALLHCVLCGPRLLLALHKWGRDLRAGDRVPYRRQFRDLLRCAFRHGLRPEIYYYLQLHRLPVRHWTHVVDPAELHHLQRDVSPADHMPLEDKLRFNQHAVSHHLPVGPLLAVWRDGRLDQAHPAVADGHGLARSLFIRRTVGYGSAGVMGFRYNPVTGAHYDAQRRYTQDELTARLAIFSLGRTLLVQPWLHNHPDLAGFSTEALCNYRIVTARHPGGRIEVLLASLRFPLGSGLTCAETDTTLCAAVDLATGRLHAASSKRPALGCWRRHPGNGQQIEGFPVPRWRELTALACAAHATWPDFAFIGWDISDTTEGPVLLEGGCLWGGYLAQMSGNPPLGETAFAAIYHEHLGRRPAAAPPCPSLVHA